MTVLPIITAAQETGPELGYLDSEQGYLPLTALDVQIDIVALTVGTRVRQVFRNATGVPLEATYIFPLPDRGAVTAFTARIGDRTIVGELKDRGEARREYDDAVAAGHRAAIAEQERSDVFSVRVGNIAPGEFAVIDLVLAAPLALDGDEATCRFPLVLAPRYIPGPAIEGDPVGDGVAMDTDLVPDASRISPPVLLPGQSSPVRLSLTCRIDPTGLGLHDLASSLHAIVAESDGEGLLVRLEPGDRLDRDFILRFRVGADDIQTAASVVPDVAGSDGESTLTVTIVPPAADPGAQQPRDVVILLDRSGSMSGWKMVAARRAAARIIDSLTSADRFAILAFDHEVDRSGGLVPGTDRERFASVQYLSSLEARGGTELHEALRQAATAVQSAPDRGGRRMLVLVTDGQVGDEDGLAGFAAALRDVDIHVVGIDQAISAGVLGRLAGLGSGAGHAEFVESEDRLDEALDKVRARIAPPVLSGITLSVVGASLVDGSVVPSGGHGCPAGVPLVLRARVRGLGDRPVRVAIEATGDSGAPWRTEIDAQASSEAAASALWAREHLRHLEDGWLTCKGEWPNRDRDRGDRLKAEMVAESIRFRVLCRFTAFIAVDPTASVGDGRPLSVVQPVESPAGWDMPAFAALRQSMASGQFHGLVASPPPMAPREMSRLGSGSEGIALRDLLDSDDALLAEMPAKPRTVSDLLDDVTRAVSDRADDTLRGLVKELLDAAASIAATGSDQAGGEPARSLERLAHQLAAALAIGTNALAGRKFRRTITNLVDDAKRALAQAGLEELEVVG